MKKIFSAFLLALMLITTSVSATTQKNFNWDNVNLVPYTSGEVYEGQVVYDIDYLALRSGPNVKYSEIARIPPGARVEVTLSSGIEERFGRNFNSNFAAVTYNGMKGYAHRGYIRKIRVISVIP